MTKMNTAVRWLLATSFVLVLCASASAAQSSPHSRKPAAHSRKSHPSHPMRNNRPKHHAVDTTRTSLLAVRYLQPQQASSVVAANSSASAAASKSSAHTSPASSKKKKSSSKKSRHSRREPTQKAPTPERISEIQSSLARGGYYQGEPNGKWDSNTVAAMQKFQSANGLDPSGKLDATSLQKLGLGSGIAGVSAPKTPCCATAPAQGRSCCPTSPSGIAPATSAPAAPAAAPKASSEPSAGASPSSSSGSTAASASSSAANTSASATGAATHSSQR
ncbi:MAG: peptidoglycan-binding domain-containing protein [Candidatus Acidiferrales bacterium]